MSIHQNSLPVTMAVKTRGDLFGTAGRIPMNQDFQPVIMVMQESRDLFGRQRSVSMDHSCQLASLAPQPVSATHLRRTKTQKLVEERFTSIHYNLRNGLSSTLERGGPQLTRTAFNEEVSPVGSFVRASSNVVHGSCHGSPRQGFLCGNELPISSAYGYGDIRGRLQSHVATGHSEGVTIVQGSTTLPEDNNGAKNTRPTTAGERGLKRPTLQAGRGGSNIRMPSARTTSEEIADLKNRQQQGITIHSNTFLEILKRCLREKDLIAARQVHACIIQSGMDKTPYVANTLLNVYVTCGRLQDARRVFDGLEKKTVFTWSTMIKGYTKSGHTEDALEAFNRMLQGGAQPDEFTCLNILKACASPLALKWGKEVHAYTRHSGLESDVRVGTALVQMYAKCGCITEARQVFEKLGTNRNVITWNVMIGASAESGYGMEAYQLFLQMQREGFIPNEITYVSILNASASKGALEWVKDVHSHALKAGLESDLRVGNVLVHMYAKSGSIDDARLIFDKLTTRDVVTWNAMIGAYAESGCGEEAYRLFLQMQPEGFIPNAITYVSILKACVSTLALKWGKEIHGYTRHAGLESHVRVGTALVQMYAKCGCITEAQKVFEKLGTNRNVITWNVMIGAYAGSGRGVEAYRLFVQMQREGFTPNAITYMNIMNASASAGALEWVKEVHRHAIKAGLESDLRVGNTLVHMYSKSGSIDEARLIFDRLKTRDVVTWSIMIGAYAENGCGMVAYQLFLRMQREGFIPNAITYVSILNASASAGALEWVKEVHRHALMAGLESDSRVGSALVHMYAKSGSLNDARIVFDRTEKRDVVRWNTMIGAYAETGCREEAYRLFLQMQLERFIPNAITYVNILNASASAVTLDWVKTIHSHAIKTGLELDLRVGTALVLMYAKSGSIDDARSIFDRMEKRDVVTWTTIIGGYAQHGCGHEALDLFRKLNAECVKPDGNTFVAVLSACCHAGLLDDGRRLFLAMTQDYGIEPTVVHYNCMVDLLGRAGHLEEAKLFISDMIVEPDGVTWKALLGACKTYGNVELGEIAAKELLNLEPKDASGYILLSNIYAAAGKWEQVSWVRTMMLERGVRKEPGRSWIEVDDKIHDFVSGDTSHPEAKAIYNELNKLTERLKAEGYIPDTQLVLQNIDEEHKELSVCSHSEKLAIAYGLMRTPHEKPIRVYKNLRVCSDCHTASKFISKVTGREIVARDVNRFHHFKDGVCSCGDYW